MSIPTIAVERQLINDTIRTFFRTRGFVEVETPLVVKSPGMEPNLSPLETEVVEPNGTRHPAGLITSPEYAMKKLLGQGLEKIFTLTKVFRNQEELGGRHNPEFTLLEWYAQGADYQTCMTETEELVKAVGRSFHRTFPNFKRRPVRDLFLEKFALNLDQAKIADLKMACDQAQIHTDPSDTESDLFYRLFLEKIEPQLGWDPVFVHDYPIHQAALSRLTPDGLYGERFELYLNGLELCNGFTELTDAQEQRRRFAEEAVARKQAGKTVFPIDEELLRLLPSIKNPTYGNALGVDRLHMLVAGRASIQEVLLFPANNIFNS
ncbi:EF-P lysine aminoacylase GenX [Patescibacteria group bacterium]|nr:EF-P lysine aminoacylase GenX [Patescibacteria group bacterium]MBU1705231.1 EF-P lysine aminoacylase GenX [Patescibacteria group bacterium]